MIFDGFDFQTRVIKLRPRQSSTCLMCKRLTEAYLDSGICQEILDSFDYNQFCGVSNYNDKTNSLDILDKAHQRISCQKFNEIQKLNDYLLIDVRSNCQFQICSLPNSLSNV